MAERPLRGELGCAGVLAAFNVVVLGFLAFTLGRLGEVGALGRGSFSIVWAGLLAVGGVAPAVALATTARRSRRAVIGLTLWMLVTLFLVVGLAINSGGGV